MRALAVLALMLLSACATPAHYTRLEDPVEASICVAKLLGVGPMTTLPKFYVEPAPFWVTYRGERIKVYGTFRRGVLPYLDVIRVAAGSRMAESVIHEFGHRYGLGEVAAEHLTTRIEECA